MGRLFRIVREVATTVVLVALVVLASRAVVQDVQVSGHSMDITLHDGERILVDTLSYRLHPPHRGDIIIFHPPASTHAQDENFVKRVIGLPGETVKVRQGAVYINGATLPEPYLHTEHTYSWGPERIPPGDLFVLGDNRDVSYDSHEWPTPFLPESAVIGRAMLAYWPLDSLHVFTAPVFARSTSTGR